MHKFSLLSFNFLSYTEVHFLNNSFNFTPPPRTHALYYYFFHQIIILNFNAKTWYEKKKQQEKEVLDKYFMRISDSHLILSTHAKVYMYVLKKNIFIGQMSWTIQFYLFEAECNFLKFPLKEPKPVLCNWMMHELYWI